MRPILLKGHERPLTFIKYNREGDLVFTCAKDHHPTLWYSDDGERVGTYIGHNGAVWTCDITGASAFHHDRREIPPLSSDGAPRLPPRRPLRRSPALHRPDPRTIRPASTPRPRAGSLHPAFSAAIARRHAHLSLPDSRLFVADDSKTFVTGSADTTCKMWDTETGVCYFTHQFEQPVRAVALSQGDQMLAISSDPFMGVPAAVHIVKVAENREEQTNEIVRSFSGPEGRINRVLWGPLNKTLLTGGEDGVIRLWDVETGKIIAEAKDHKKQIQHLSMSEDKTHFISASLDKTAKLFDSTTLECMKTYAADRPVNAAIISPIRDHIILGGGQDAMAVTTTHSKAGKFDSKIYYKIFEEEIGGIRGHFGPINALAFHPDGRSFTTGGEDGYVRIHHLDNDYFRIK